MALQQPCALRALSTEPKILPYRLLRVAPAGKSQQYICDGLQYDDIHETSSNSEDRKSSLISLKVSSTQFEISQHMARYRTLLVSHTCETVQAERRLVVGISEVHRVGDERDRLPHAQTRTDHSTKR